MAYCTVADVLGMISDTELALLTSEVGGVDEAVVNEGIEKADAEIDAYLGLVTRVPVSPAPPLLTSLSVDMAIYHIFSRRSVMAEIRRRKYEDALALLRLIAQGRATVPGLQPEAAAGEVFIASNPRLFTRRTMESM